MTQTARPLRALAIMLCLYGGGRLALAARFPEFAVLGFQPMHAPILASGSSRPFTVVTTALMRAVATMPGLPTMPARAPWVGPAVLVIAVPLAVTHARLSTARAAGIGAPTRLIDRNELPRTVAALVQTGPVGPPALTGGSGAAQATLPPTSGRSRALSGSAWLLVREGSAGTSLAPGGTLGGSQAGARITWQPGVIPVFLTVRASGALSVRDSEIAPGIGVRGRQGGVILEQRIPLQRGRSSRTALLGYGGVSDVRAPAGVTLDGYAQGGVVGVSNPALFIDGSARAERRLATSGSTALGVGAGIWGAAQPGATRLDVGPQVVLHAPLGSAGARLSAEYRVRVAGRARPGNGFTLTLGTDF